MALGERIGRLVVETEDPDGKFGNGFAVVIAADGPEPPPLTRAAADTAAT